MKRWTLFLGLLFCVQTTSAEVKKSLSCATCTDVESSNPDHVKIKNLYMGLRETAQRAQAGPARRIVKPAPIRECGLVGTVIERITDCKTRRTAGKGWSLVTRRRAANGSIREIWRDDAPGGLIWSDLEDEYEVRADRTEESLANSRRDIGRACSSEVTAAARGKDLSTAWVLPTEADFQKAIQNGLRAVVGKDHFDRAYWLKPHAPGDADYRADDDSMGYAVFEAYEGEPQKEVLMMRKNPSSYSVRCVLRP